MRTLATLVLAVAALSQTVAAQSKASAIQATVERVVDSVARIAEQNYVFPDTGRMVADHLRKRLRDGAYRSVTELAQLADRLTADMQAINGDRHLYTTFSGRAQTGGEAGVQTGVQSGVQTGGTAGLQMIVRRVGAADVMPPDIWAQRANYDLNAVQRLAGNVGYISLGRLSTRGSDEAFSVIDAAMAFLERTDAVIIDLRNTVGGDSRMSDYFASYFFGPEPVPTLASYSRQMNQSRERTTVAIKGKRRPEIPVFVLVGRGTASGTEDFAFILKQTGRGTLVGGRTAGAGRLTRMFPVGDGFVASVSGGRTYDPRTGQEWERVGIEPHVPTSGDDALTVAHAAALERVASATTDTVWKNALTWTRTAVLARAKPATIPERTLREYAGEYDLRVVRFENGKLWYQRDTSRTREELIPVNERTFALGEATRVEFVRDGARITAMNLVNPLGQISTLPRTR
jgi:hypothetical protein